MELQVMTFNVRNEHQDTDQNAWVNRRSMVADMLRTLQPDVVGLQESSGDIQLADLDKAVPGLRLLTIGGQDQGRRNSILYRTDRFTVDSAGIFWYSDTPEVFSTHWGNSYPRSCTWARFVEAETGGGFYHFNTHFDHKSENSRLNSIQMLTKRIAGRSYKEPFVVTGDFNSGEDSVVVNYLKGGQIVDLEDAPSPPNLVPLVDSFRAYHPDAHSVGTGHGFTGRRTGSKIDYVFIPATVKVLEARIITTEEDSRYPSDHFPVTATVRLPDPSDLDDF